MSRSFSVIVLCPNGRRETVKVTPNCSILQVLEEACKKQKLCPDDYDMRHYNRTLDPSLPIRFANLPNNALLELRPALNSRQDCLVTVGLLLESGERITKDFLPSSSVSDVLEQCLSSDSISLQEIGEPVCIYMRQKITGDSIKSTTLRSLGLTKGKAIIRLLYRKPEELEHQAHISSPLTVTSIEHMVSQSTEHKMVPQVDKYQSPDSPNCEQVCSDNTVKNERMVSEMEIKSSKPDQDTTMEVDCNENAVKEENITETSIARSERNACYSEETNIDSTANVDCDSNIEDDTFEGLGDINYIGDRHAVLYSLDDITNIKKADLPDEFFDLTVNDAKYIMAQYTKQRAELENQPLLTKEQRQGQLLQKLAHYSQTVIRIYFPERLVLQAVFTAVETVQTVSDFVQNYLEDKSLKFYLYITPPKEKLNPSKTLLESMLVPAAVVYFGCDIRRPCYLVGNLRTSLSDPRAAALAASESWKISFSNVPLHTPNQSINIDATEESVLQNVTTVTNVSQCPRNTNQEKLPKWLKLSKK